jgi:molybdenum cofactor guanylyltransferase
MLAIVLTGGLSSRMGKDKALIKVHGKTILDRTIELLKPYSDEVFVSIRKDQSQELNRSKYPMLIDDLNFKGPMAGIMSAAKHNASSAWIIVSCDLPLLDVETMDQLLEMRAEDKDATVFSNEGTGIEPLCSIYEPALLQRFKENPETIINMSPQLTLRGMNLNIIQPRSEIALYNLNRITPEISKIIEIE